MDLSTIHAEMFEKSIGEVFEHVCDGFTVELTLTSVTLSPHGNPGLLDRHPFTLDFVSKAVPPSSAGASGTLKNETVGDVPGVTVVPNAGAPSKEWAPGYLWSATFA